MPLNASGNGQVEIRPRCGLMPTRCVHAAGMRTLPAPSEPIAAVTRPGGHRGGATAGRSARSVPTRPGVAGVSEPGPAGERPLAQLAGVRLADDHRAGRLQTAHHLGVVGGRPDVPLGAEGGWHSSNVDVVFDRDRDAQQRRGVAGGSPPIGLRGVGQRRLGEHHAEGVQGGLTQIDGVQ